MPAALNHPVGVLLPQGAGGERAGPAGIIAYLKNSGKLEIAQHIANHESPGTDHDLGRAAFLWWLRLVRPELRRLKPAMSQTWVLPQLSQAGHRRQTMHADFGLAGPRTRHSRDLIL
jgi:hypothetical protein